MQAQYVVSFTCSIGACPWLRDSLSNMPGEIVGAESLGGENSCERVGRRTEKRPHCRIFGTERSRYGESQLTCGTSSTAGTLMLHNVTKYTRKPESRGPLNMLQNRTGSRHSFALPHCCSDLVNVASSLRLRVSTLLPLERVTGSQKPMSRKASPTTQDPNRVTIMYKKATVAAVAVTAVATTPRQQQQHQWKKTTIMFCIDGFGVEIFACRDRSRTVGHFEVLGEVPIAHKSGNKAAQTSHNSICHGSVAFFWASVALMLMAMRLAIRSAYQF